jgi:hypothetical protein
VEIDADALRIATRDTMNVQDADRGRSGTQQSRPRRESTACPALSGRPEPVEIDFDTLRIEFRTEKTMFERL